MNDGSKLSSGCPLPLKIIVSENRMYASIRIHQQREYPGRVVGTSFANPDFELIGGAFSSRP